MPLFPVLDTENVVQENDKTRLDASKSYAAGVSPVSFVSISPAQGEPFIVVSENSYLDWQYDFTFEINAANDKIDFVEGAAAFVATLTHGVYTAALLAAEVQTKMRAAGALLYVVSVSSDNTFTIAAPAAFSLLPITGVNASTTVLLDLGFGVTKAQGVTAQTATDHVGKATYAGLPVERVEKNITLRIENAVVVDATNDLLDYALASVSGAVQATIAHATYESYAAFLEAVQAALNANTAGAVFVVSESGGQVTIEATALPGATFALLPATGAGAATNGFGLMGLGGGDTLDDPTSFTGSVVPQIKTMRKKLAIISEQADRLFSTDDKLRKHEFDILKYVPDGRASYKDVHRRAQELILAWLDTQGFIDDLGIKFTAKRIRKIDEVTEWATIVALRLIFEGIANAEDDVFTKKSEYYEGREEFYRNRAVLRIDMNEDGKVDISEELDVRSCRVLRR